MYVLSILLLYGVVPALVSKKTPLHKLVDNAVTTGQGAKDNGRYQGRRDPGLAYRACR